MQGVSLMCVYSYVAFVLECKICIGFLYFSLLFVPYIGRVFLKKKMLLHTISVRVYGSLRILCQTLTVD